MIKIRIQIQQCMTKRCAGRPHDTSVQKATSDIENVDAVQRYVLDITWCGCSLTSCPGRLFNRVSFSRKHCSRNQSSQARNSTKFFIFLHFQQHSLPIVN